MRETENNKRYKAAMQGVRMQNVKMQSRRRQIKDHYR